MKKGHIGYLLLGLLWVFLAWSCTPLDERVSDNPSSGLNFSSDSIKFDTVITVLRSPTRRLYLRNPNSEAINLQSVALERGGASPFSLIVNGRAGAATNMILRGRDSIMVLVEALTQNALASPDIILEDNLVIRVQGRGGEQKVAIRAFGQNAYYLRDSVLDCRTSNLIWDQTDRPYVLQNSILVPKGCTLTIRPGVRVYSFQFSNILVQGTLRVEGTRDQPVTFLGTRQEPRFDNQPDQWGTIAFLDSSQGNLIRFAKIYNGTHGVQVGTPSDAGRVPPSLLIHNTEIRTMSGVGIYSFGGRITAYNNLIADCAQFGIACQSGGQFAFWHNTVAYSGNFGFQRRTPGVVFTDFYDDGSGTRYLSTPLRISFANNIVMGNQEDEFGIGEPRNPPITLDVDGFRGNVIRLKPTSLFDGSFNTTTSFVIGFANARQYNFRIPTSSQAAGRGRPLSDFPSNWDIPSPTFEFNQDFSGAGRSFAQPDAGMFNAQ